MFVLERRRSRSTSRERERRRRERSRSRDRDRRRSRSRSPHRRRSRWVHKVNQKMTTQLQRTKKPSRPRDFFLFSVREFTVLWNGETSPYFMLKLNRILGKMGFIILHMTELSSKWGIVSKNQLVWCLTRVRNKYFLFLLVFNFLVVTVYSSM